MILKSFTKMYSAIFEKRLAIKLSICIFSFVLTNPSYALFTNTKDYPYQVFGLSILKNLMAQQDADNPNWCKAYNVSPTNGSTLLSYPSSEFDILAGVNANLADSKDRLTITSYNLHALGDIDAGWGGIDLGGETTKTTHCAGRTAALPQPEVIAFQELWDSEWLTSLYLAMEEDYYLYWNNYSQNGLVIAFRKDLIENQNVETWKTVFNDCHGNLSTAYADDLDCLKEKGFLHAKFQKSGQVWHIINTHLDADGNALADHHANGETRRLQMEQIKNYVASSTQINNGDHVIVLGDYNVPLDDSAERNNMNSIFSNYSEMTMLSGSQPYSAPSHHQWLDYILVKDNGVLKTVSEGRAYRPRTQDHTELSDHLPIVGEVAFVKYRITDFVVAAM